MMHCSVSVRFSILVLILRVYILVLQPSVLFTSLLHIIIVVKNI